MKLSERTKEMLAYRKGVRALKADGYIEVSENGHPLYKFHRGEWLVEPHYIADVKIGPDRISLWIKVAAESRGRSPADRGPSSACTGS
jgi:hypothetical protein